MRFLFAAGFCTCLVLAPSAAQAGNNKHQGHLNPHWQVRHYTPDHRAQQRYRHPPQHGYRYEHFHSARPYYVYPHARYTGPRYYRPPVHYPSRHHWRHGTRYYAPALGAVITGSIISHRLYHRHRGVVCYERHNLYPGSHRHAGHTEIAGCHRIERLPNGTQRRVEVPLSQCY
ncbi:MAG: hypothetical protein NXI15_06450 [Gammaproteobacteria bacterium]|nr:hypothetical protein [Gammaproteobacteria bacterium]